MKSFNLPEPEFEQKQVGGAIVRVTLHNSQNLQAKWIDSDVTGIVGPDVADQMWRTN